MKFKVFRTWCMSVLLTGSLITNTVCAEELFAEEAAVVPSVEAEAQEVSVIPSAEEDGQEATVSEDLDIQLEEAAPEEDEEQILDMSVDYEEEDLEDTLALLALAEAAEPATSGQCGDQMNWSLKYEEGSPYILIEGNGKMWDYSPSNRPGWEIYPADIVVLEGHITSIGAYAFYKEENLELIATGEYVESIGDYAFAECPNLWYTGLTPSLKTIGNSAFENCDLILDQYCYENVTSIGARAFAGNSELTSIFIKGKNTTIGKDAFKGCSSDLIIYCDPDSKAAAYAQANGIAHASGKILIDTCNISLSQTSFTYDGEEKNPVPTVKYGDTTLVEDVDYAYVVSDNINAGTASVDIYGIGKYDGATTVTFTIKKAQSQITANDLTATVSSSKAQKLPINAKLNRSGKLTYTSNKTGVTVDSKGNAVIEKNFSGTAKITISAAEAANYEAVEKVIKVVVNKKDNVIKASNKTLTGNPTKAQTFLIKPKAKGKVTFKYSSDNKNITVNKKGKVTVKKNYTGTANITITTSATKIYRKTEKVITVTVNKKNNTITAKNITVQTNPSAAKTVDLKASAPGKAKLTYSSDNKNITVNSAGKVTIKKGYVGKATITIKAAATKVFNETEKKISVTVTKADNTISAENKSVYVNVAQNTTIALGAKVKGGAALTYKSDNAKITVNANGTVTVAKGYSGTATITISSSETSVYKAATKKVKISVNKRENTIQASGYTTNASSTAQTHSINASVKGGAHLTYRSNNSSVYVSNTGRVTIHAGFSGEAVITITAAETAEYKGCSKQIVIKVEKLKQLLTFKPTAYSPTALSLKTKPMSFELIPLKHEGEVSLRSKSPAYVQVMKTTSKGEVHHIVTVKQGTPAGVYKIEIRAAATSIYAEEVKEFNIIVN